MRWKKERGDENHSHRKSGEMRFGDFYTEAKFWLSCKSTENWGHRKFKKTSQCNLICSYHIYVLRSGNNFFPEFEIFSEIAKN